MRSPEYWRDRWAEPPTHTDLATENEKREKTGFVSIIAWPLTLLVLQGSVFAPLFGSGFLGSPFDDGTDGIIIAPTAQDPGILLPGDLALDPPGGVDDSQQPEPKAPEKVDEEGDTPARDTPTPEPTGSPTEPSNDPTDPGVDPLPEVIELNLETDSESSASLRNETTVLDKTPIFPGQTRSILLKINNTGNVNLGELTMKVDTANKLYSEPTQGLEVHTWSCDSPWGGTAKKPICSGGSTAGKMFKVNQGTGNIGITGGEGGSSKYILTAFKLPSIADDRFQNSTTTLTVNFTAQMVG